MPYSQLSNDEPSELSTLIERVGNSIFAKFKHQSDHYTTIHVGTAQAEAAFWWQQTVKKVCTAVLFNNSKWEEQHANKLISPQEVKLRCGIHYVNSLRGPESKSYKLFDKQFSSGCIQGYGGRGFCSNFQESSRICSMVYLSSLRLLCQEETIRALLHRIFV